MKNINIKNYIDIPINYREIIRYYNGGKDCIEDIDNALLEGDNIFSFSVCFLEVPLKIENDIIDFDGIKIKSKDLSKNLSGCDSAIIFVATIGIGIDRLIKKYSSISPSRSLLFQAIGAERIESLCNTFCKDLKEKYKYICPRFSAGFGDLKLETQREIFRILNPINIGVTLSEGLTMTPSKSVSAFVGIKKQGGK